MSRAQEDLNRRMLRARDVMDRSYAEALDIPALAAVAHVSAAHFIRSFRAVFGETPHRYLQRRRVERAMFLLRTGDRPVTQICFEVGFSSLGTFSRTFTAIVGESPSSYRGRGPLPPVPSCFALRWARPSEHVAGTSQPVAPDPSRPYGARMTTPSFPTPPATERQAPPHQGDEVTLLRSYVAFLRDSLRMKAEGLTAEQLHARHEPSDLTLGGLLKHLAFVEHWWFSCVLRGTGFAEPWASVDWDADEDWDHHSAAQDSPMELFALYDATIAESDRITEEALATPAGLETLAQRHPRDGEPVSLRYVLLHMIEEYGRHTGHADLIRESIDGATGE